MQGPQSKVALFSTRFEDDDNDDGGDNDDGNEDEESKIRRGDGMGRCNDSAYRSPNNDSRDRCVSTDVPPNTDTVRRSPFRPDRRGEGRVISTNTRRRRFRNPCSRDEGYDGGSDGGALLASGCDLEVVVPRAALKVPATVDPRPRDPEPPPEEAIKVCEGDAGDSRAMQVRTTREALDTGRVRISSRVVAQDPITVDAARSRAAGPVEKVPWSSLLLDAVAPGDLPQGAALFYSLDREEISAARIGNIIDAVAREKKVINFVVWVNHHWVASQLVPGSSWRIFDSSRDGRNEDRIRTWAKDIGLPIPSFPAIPQQRSHSLECGIFTFLMMWKLNQGSHIPELRFLPSSLRPRWPSLKPLIHLMRDPAHAAQVGWQILRGHYSASEKVVWKVSGGEGPYRANQHLRVRWHWLGKPEEVFKDRAFVESCGGTERRTTYRLQFEPLSQLGGANRFFMLPQPHGSNVVVLHHQIDNDPVPIKPVSEAHSDLDSHEEEMSEEEHHRFYESFVRDTRVETYREPSNTASTGLRPLTVGEFLKARIKPLDEARDTCPALVWTAMISETRRGHIKELKALREYVQALPLQHPLDMAIARYAEKARDSRKLAWSSVSRIIQSLIGAFAVFPNYATGEDEEFPPIFINKWPGIRDSLKTAKRLSNTVGVREPVAATPSQVTEAFEFLSEHDRVFLQVCWLTSQRPGDVVHVRSEHVSLMEDHSVIRFAEGKNHAATDQYAIHCVVPTDWAPGWRCLLAIKRKFLFEVPTKSARFSLMRRVREALRRTKGGEKLEMKSLRRGSLQTMAENGCSVAELLKFSRHQDAKTLRRYLSYDAVADAENQRALEHTRILAGGPVTVTKLESWCAIEADGDVSFGALPKPRSKRYRSDYRYHIKDVQPINLDAVSKLAAGASEGVRKDWEDTRKFLEDASRYSGVPCGPPLRSRIRRKMVQQLLDVDQIQELSVAQTRNYCVVFVIPEDEKLRWRIIKHPKAINDALHDIVEELAVSKTNATRRAARFAVLDHPGCLEFDFAGYFDQFPLSEEVSHHFVFYDGRKRYAPKRLLMGASFSVAIATAATRVLTDGIGEGMDVAVSHQIDNVRLAGNEKDCRIVARRFLDRCSQAGVTLNDVDVEPLHGHTNDFMGDEVDFRTKSIRCRAKQQSRLTVWMAKVREKSATFRDWFACYGTAAYMAEALGITPAQHYQVRLFVRLMARALSRSPLLWNEPMPFPPPWKAWQAFMKLVQQNIPATLALHPSSSAKLFVDASRYGVGALCLGPDSERAFMRPREWTMKEREDWSLGLSTVAEPRALVEAVRWAAQLFPQCTVEVYSDHQPFVEAFWRGGSFSPGYNDALLTLGELNVPLVLYHVAGESMPADGMSRGVSEAPTALDWQNAAKWVEAAALSSLRYYRIIGGGIGARTFSSGGARHPHTHKAHSVSMP